MPRIVRAAISPTGPHRRRRRRGSRPSGKKTGRLVIGKLGAVATEFWRIPIGNEEYPRAKKCAISLLIHIRLALGSRRIYGVLAIAGLCAVMSALSVDDEKWPLEALPLGAWVMIASATTYFSMGGQKRISAET